MDARKIQFLIGIQREIDKLEAKEGNTPKVERVKSRFYDVVEVEEMVKMTNQSKQDTVEIVNELILLPSEDIEIKRPVRLAPKEREEKLTKLKQLKVDDELIASPLLSINENTVEAKEITISINKDIVKNKRKNTSKENEKEAEKNHSHKPKDVAAFLVRFRDRKNRGLKYLTHRWSDMKKGQPLNYNEVVANAKKELQECRKQYDIPDSLYYKVLEYVAVKTSVRSKNGYFNRHPHFFYSIIENGKVVRKDVFFGWSSDELIEWVNNNLNSDPNQDDYWKKELIQPFKQAIEVRDGMFENYLRMNAEAILKDDYNKFNPIYGDSLKEARFFTDVPTLLGGIRKLLAAAKDSAKEPFLKFDYFIPETTDLYGIRQIKIITDKNPNIGSSSITKSQLSKGGDLGDAFEHFFGLCNWSIQCKRGNESVRINILTDVDDVPEIEVINETEIEGFTHILTFYDL